MRFCAELASAKLTSLPRSGTTGGTTDRQRGILLGFHGPSIMQNRQPKVWSILNRLVSYRFPLQHCFEFGSEFQYSLLPKMMTHHFIIPMVLQLEILAILGINLRNFCTNACECGRQ